MGFAVELRSDPATAEARAEVLAKPSFGQAFTDHMVVANWTADRGWHDAKVTAYAPIKVSPAAAVLHYSQEIFEGSRRSGTRTGRCGRFGPIATPLGSRRVLSDLRCRMCRRTRSSRHCVRW